MNNKIRPYNYEVLKDDIGLILRDFPDVEVGSIGNSVWGNKLYYIRIGNGKNKILYNGAHHGMEWITSAMLMRFVREFLTAKKNGKSMRGFAIDAICKRTSLYVVPMVNPDGVRLATEGLPRSLSQTEKQTLLRMNGSSDFSQWQANANGVDLNHNYDAMWQKSKALEREYGIYSAGPTRFSGKYPECQPESHALAEFTRSRNFSMTIAFHSQGKVIYQGFLGEFPPRSTAIAKAFTKISPYRIDETDGIASYGGYKDWFVSKFNKPGYTIEVGEGRNPLPIEQLPKIYAETLPIMLGAMTVSD